MINIFNLNDNLVDQAVPMFDVADKKCATRKEALCFRKWVPSFIRVSLFSFFVMIHPICALEYSEDTDSLVDRRQHLAFLCQKLFSEEPASKAYCDILFQVANLWGGIDKPVRDLGQVVLLLEKFSNNDEHQTFCLGVLQNLYAYGPEGVKDHRKALSVLDRQLAAAAPDSQSYLDLLFMKARLLESGDEAIKDLRTCIHN